MPPLKNTRYERYAQGRLLGLSKQKAYLEAGFGGKKNPEANAHRNAHKLEKRKDVRDRIRELQDAVASENILKREEAELILSEIARASITDFAGLEKDGSVTFSPTESGMASGRAIKELKSRRVYNKNTKEDALLTTIRLHDPREAIARLAKLKGWDAPKKLAIDLNRSLDEMSDDELRQLAGEDDSEATPQG